MLYNGGEYMVILGIDPGYAIIGYGALEYLRGKFRVLGYGAITTEAGESISRRLRRIYDGKKSGGQNIRSQPPAAICNVRIYSL